MLKELKNLLNTHKNFLKFVVATLVKFAKSDHHYSDEVIISKVAGVFELNEKKKSIFERLKKLNLINHVTKFR